MRAGNDSLDARSCSRSRSSCFAFRAAAPARPAATFFGSLTFSVTLSTGRLCAGSSAVSLLLCNVVSSIDTLTGQLCPNLQCFKVVSAAVNGAKNMP